MLAARVVIINVFKVQKCIEAAMLDTRLATVYFHFSGAEIISLVTVKQ